MLQAKQNAWKEVAKHCDCPGDSAMAWQHSEHLICTDSDIIIWHMIMSKC